MKTHICFATSLFMVSAVPSEAPAIQPGAPVDVAPFGQVERWDADGRDYGVFWEDARDVFRVVVRFADPKKLPGPETVRILYWQSSWPQHRIPRDAPSGAGSSGWLNVGDWYQGDWVEADTQLEVNGATYIFTFNPVNAKEYPDLEDFAARYRSTLKLRLLAKDALPEIDGFETYTDSVWAPLEFEAEWGATAQGHAQTWDGRLEIFNGIIQMVEALSNTALGAQGSYSWTSRVQDAAGGIRARILHTATAAYNSFDETVVTLRTSHETFSFAVCDLLEHGHIFLPGYGVIVRKAGDTTTYAEAEGACRRKRNESIYHRVLSVPEQTLPRAWDDIPAKGRFYIPLSFEGGRQHFGVNPDASVFCDWHWLSRIPGRDTKRCLYDGNRIHYSFHLSESDLVDRSLVDGCLPMLVTEFERDGVHYTNTAFVVPLDGVPKPGERIHADDTLVLMSRFEMKRAGQDAAEAALDFRAAAQEPEALEWEDGCIVSPTEDIRRLCMAVTVSNAEGPKTIEAKTRTVTYRAPLSDEYPVRTLDVAIPYITFTQAQEWERVQALSFKPLFEAVRAYWRDRVDQSAQITTLEPMINDFYKAHVSHLLINTEREVGDSDCYMAKVGTFSYGVYSNESCMMVSDLDRRGYHERAAQALETWLHYQGTVGLPGDFSSTEGQFYGAAGYESGGYNQHHGFVLWCLGEHYRYTRDTAWLEHAAPGIAKACDWIINERKRTIAEADRSPIRAIERGLLPPGYLEDIKDWRSWLSTNVYSWWGMHNAAAALADAGLPEGKRLIEEAAAYRHDILEAFTEAMRRCPVVQLRDGRWVPHVPPEVHRRGRTFGWITETLEGPIHMVRTGIIDPQGRLATWIIEDFEDNLYLSKQYGYDIAGEDFERYWFSRGGISMQANLLCNPIPYLLRDEPEHFLRAYFNAFAVSYFTDTRMMTEHALPNIGDWRGDHYKASDEANSTYWLRMMFVREEGDELWLGQAIPRYWLAEGKTIGIENARTYFGPMSVTFTPHIAEGRIEAIVDPPLRNAPKRILVRFRHPSRRAIVRCKVNGERHSQFDAQKEWVVLSDCTARTTITTYYE